MTTRRFALTLAAAAAVLGAALFSPAPATAQGYGVQHVGQAQGLYPPDPKLRQNRIRPIPPDYGYGTPHYQKRYGHGPGRQWKRGARNPHPAYRPHGWRQPGWARPRAYDHRY